MKAVGNHLVLTFCYSLPEVKQMFSIILARENHLDHRDIQGTHSFLRRQGLWVKAIEHSCNGAEINKLSLIFAVFGVVTVFLWNIFHFLEFIKFSTSLNFWIFPEVVFGNDSTISSRDGILKWAIFPLQYELISSRVNETFGCVLMQAQISSPSLLWGIPTTYKL